MAGSTIKGITIQINGETTALNKALGEVNTTSKNLQSELKQVEKLLQLDPSNTELLAQKEKLLADAIGTAKEKLDTLKTAAEQASSKLASGDIGEEQFRALQREVIKAGQSLGDLTEKQNAFKSSAGDAADKADKLGNELKTAGNKAETLGSNFDSAKDKFITFGDAVKASAIGNIIANAVSSASAALKNMTSGALESADSVQELADETGMSAEQIQQWEYIGDDLGVSIDTITGAQMKLTKSMNAARTGTGTQADAFAALGVSVTDANGNLRDAQTVMAEAFDALGNVGNETERDALSMAIFGKSASDLNPLIVAGSDTLNSLAQAAVDSGAVMSNEAIAGLDAFGDSVDHLKSSAKGAVGTFVAEFAPALTDVSDSLSGLLTGSVDIDTFVGKISTLMTQISSAVVAALPSILKVGAGILTALLTGLITSLPSILPAGLQIVTELAISIVQYLPTLLDTALQIIIQLATGISQSLPTLTPTVVDIILQIVQTLIDNIPALINVALTLVTALAQGIITALPTLISQVPQIIVSLVTTLTNPNMITKIINCALSLIQSLALGLVDALPQLVAKLPQIITSIVTGLTNPDMLTQIITGAITLVIALAGGLIKAIPTLVKSLPQIIAAIVGGIGSGVSAIGEVGVNLIKGLWNGIGDALGWLKNKILGLGSTILGWIKGIFGIHSPSTETAYFGQMLGQGLGVGFLDSMKSVKSTIGDAAKGVLGAIDSDFSATVAYATGSSSGSTTNNTSSIVNNSPVINLTINTSGGMTESEIVSTVNRALGKVYA